VGEIGEERLEQLLGEELGDQLAAAVETDLVEDRL
jgi:hypothetical protein